MCGCVSAYVCAIVTDGCCSRPHPPCLGTDPSFPHEQEELGSQREMFPITNNIWGTSGEPIPGQGDTSLEKTHHLFDYFYSPIFSLILSFLYCPPNPSPIGLSALSPHCSPCQLPALVSVPSSFPSTLPSRMQT